MRQGGSQVHLQHKLKGAHIMSAVRKPLLYRRKLVLSVGYSDTALDTPESMDKLFDYTMSELQRQWPCGVTSAEWDPDSFEVLEHTRSNDE